MLLGSVGGWALYDGSAGDWDLIIENILNVIILKNWILSISMK